MKAVVLNHSGSKLDLSGNGVALRIGYLFCEEVASAGTDYFLIDYKRWFSLKTLEAKITFVQDHEKAMTERQGREPYTSDLDKLLQAYNILSKIKSKSKDDIVVMKRAEKLINEEYNRVKEEQMEQYRIWGLLQFEPLTHEDCFNVYATDNTDPEKKEDEWYHSLSSLLMGDFTERPGILKQRKQGEVKKEEPILFILAPQFFNPEFGEHMKQTSIGTKFSFYMEPCFILPNYNGATVTEMQALRHQLSGPGANWRSLMNEWMQMVYGQKDSGTKKFFRKKVLPAAKDFQKQVDQLELNQDLVRRQKDLQLQLLIGEMPVQVIWEFYRCFKVANDDTWEALNKAKEGSKDFNGSWPVMSFALAKGELPDEPVVAETAEVAPTKKHLDID